MKDRKGKDKRIIPQKFVKLLKSKLKVEGKRAILSKIINRIDYKNTAKRNKKPLVYGTADMTSLY